MKLLFIGGTQFVGRHMVEAALARGHEVTLFNRGTKPETFPGIEQVRGDRDGGLGALAGRSWDAVIDTPGYLPGIVRQSAEALRDSVGRYLFVSTISVYADFETAGMDEDALLAKMQEGAADAVSGETYGPLKVLCEEAVSEIYGSRSTIVRPGYVVGPHDHTDRFTYWVMRAAEGGEMLGTARPEAPLQCIDGRDLGAFAVGLVESDTPGVFNATGPEAPLTWGEFLAVCVDSAGSEAAVAWPGHAFLREHGLHESGELPMFDGEAYENILAVSIDRALAAGLKTRPLADTIRDTREWRGTVERPLVAGLSREREQQLLAAWRATQQA